jgi:glutamine amidotransferase
MIALVDSGVSNLASVIGALARVRAPVQVVREADVLARAPAIILPGVGAFGDGMAGLRSRGLIAPLQAAARAGKPILGICLGMQLLVAESEEHGRHEGLGLLTGRVRRLVADEPGFRVPNMGWCDISIPRPGALFPDQDRQQSFYFVHSYFVDTAPENVTATIAFSGCTIPAALEAENISGVQFHPEKSQDAGLDLLARWVARLGVEA